MGRCVDDPLRPRLVCIVATPSSWLPRVARTAGQHRPAFCGGARGGGARCAAGGRPGVRNAGAARAHTRTGLREEARPHAPPSSPSERHARTASLSPTLPCSVATKSHLLLDVQNTGVRGARSAPPPPPALHLVCSRGQPPPLCLRLAPIASTQSGAFTRLGGGRLGPPSSLPDSDSAFAATLFLSPRPAWSPGPPVFSPPLLIRSFPYPPPLTATRAPPFCPIPPPPP